MHRAANPKLQVRQGFTLIELMVVIGILLILIGFLFVAGQKLIASNRITATRGTLNNLSGLLAELDAATGLRTQPSIYLWSSVNGMITEQLKPGASLEVPGQTQDFWKAPRYLRAGPPLVYDALDSPRSVVDDGDSGTRIRNGSVAIVNTSLAMSLLASLPQNRTALTSMPQQQQYALTWQSGELPHSATDRINGTMDDSTPPGPNVQYVLGAHVRLAEKSGSDVVMHYYYANTNYPAGNPQPMPNSPATGWTDETNAPFHAPLLLDAWGNPIIFVPACGMRIWMSSGLTQYDPNTHNEQRWIVISPEGEVTNNGTAQPTVTRLGRPFFASAGPDGNFDTGDDNIYSFEK